MPQLSYASSTLVDSHAQAELSGRIGRWPSLPLLRHLSSTAIDHDSSRKQSMHGRRRSLSSFQRSFSRSQPPSHNPSLATLRPTYQTESVSDVDPQYDMNQSRRPGMLKRAANLFFRRDKSRCRGRASTPHSPVDGDTPDSSEPVTPDPSHMTYEDLRIPPAETTSSKKHVPEWMPQGPSKAEAAPEATQRSLRPPPRPPLRVSPSEVELEGRAGV